MNPIEIYPKTRLSTFLRDEDGKATHIICRGCKHFRPIYHYTKGSGRALIGDGGRCVLCRLGWVKAVRWLERLYERKYCTRHGKTLAKCMFNIKVSKGMCIQCRKDHFEEKREATREAYEIKRRSAIEPNYPYVNRGLCDCGLDDKVEVQVTRAGGTYYPMMIHKKDLPLIYGETLNFTSNRYIKVSRPYDYSDSTKNGMVYDDHKVHRLVLFGKNEGSNPLFADHIDENGLNNTRCNLRPATFDQNIWHSRPKSIKNCKYKGVSRRKNAKTNPWLARLTMKGKTLLNTYHPTAKSAALAYDKAAKKYYKKFAWLNQHHYPKDFI